MKKGIDSITKQWIRTPGDERAAREGCRFDPERARFVVDWIERYCRLYEGEYAGQPLTLRDWALEATMQIFGWVTWSEKWRREVRRFRQASIWVPKKNKKSPTLAAWGLYLLCGDGEPGQKVYLGAKDGTQARDIAGKHALEMLRQSPELTEACSINRSLMQITHEASRSIMKPLSSSNEKTQQSKEGLNGSVLIDETHVVDRAFVQIINRAGISRSEPLHIEVSTAGNNPAGYGKERFDYASSVREGKIIDPRLYVAIYAAPQDLTDAELDKDPAKFGRMANPAWGHTIDPDEFLSDYQRSKATIAAMLDFKMYRLNIWQSSSNPWIRSGDWAACRQEFTEADLEGQPCVMGLDLGRTSDMSCAALVFPAEDGAFKVLPYFWLPEEYARENNHKVSFLEWAKAGFLRLTPGSTIDYGYIEADLRSLIARFDVMELVYDQHYANELTTRISDGQSDPSGKVITEGTGVVRVPFPQTMMTFTAPSTEFERLILAGKMHHNGHPLLAWEVGHVQTRRDNNNNIRPIKPATGDIKKIDGVVATVMALSRATVAQPQASVYETRGIMTL